MDTNRSKYVKICQNMSEYFTRTDSPENLPQSATHAKTRTCVREAFVVHEITVRADSVDDDE